MHLSKELSSRRLPVEVDGAPGAVHAVCPDLQARLFACETLLEQRTWDANPARHRRHRQLCVPALVAFPRRWSSGFLRTPGMGEALATITVRAALRRLRTRPGEATTVLGRRRSFGTHAVLLGRTAVPCLRREAPRHARETAVRCAQTEYRGAGAECACKRRWPPRQVSARKHGAASMSAPSGRYAVGRGEGTEEPFLSFSWPISTCGGRSGCVRPACRCTGEHRFELRSSMPGRGESGRHPAAQHGSASSDAITTQQARHNTIEYDAQSWTRREIDGRASGVDGAVRHQLHSLLAALAHATAGGSRILFSASLLARTAVFAVLVEGCYLC